MRRERPYLTPVFVHFLKTLIEREVVPDRVLPPGGGVGEIREVLEDPVVNVFDGKPLGGCVLDGHEDEAAEGVRRLAVGVVFGVVGQVRGGRGGRRVVVGLLHGAHAPQHRVAEARQQVLALVQPVQVGQLLVLGARLLQLDGRHGQRQLQFVVLTQRPGDGAHLVQLTQAARHSHPGSFRLLTGRHDRTHLDQGSCGGMTKKYIHIYINIIHYYQFPQLHSITPSSLLRLCIMRK